MSPDGGVAERKDRDQCPGKLSETEQSHGRCHPEVDAMQPQARLEQREARGACVAVGGTTGETFANEYEGGRNEDKRSLAGRKVYHRKKVSKVTTATKVK